MSSLVKESRFFLGALTGQEYDRLFDQDSSANRVEVDTALWSDPNSVSRIVRYNPEIRVAIILRNPCDFAVSRFIHGRRKGELLVDDLEHALLHDESIVREMSYAANIDRFVQAGLQTRSFRFENLSANPTDFYHGIRNYLLGGYDRFAAHPALLNERVNVARNSSAGAIPSVLSAVAKKSRSMGLHAVVNSAKRLPLVGRLEQPAEPSEKRDLRTKAQSIVEHYYPSAVSTWELAN